MYSPLNLTRLLCSLRRYSRKALGGALLLALVLVAEGCAASSPKHEAATQQVVLYVAMEGNDAWSGTSAQPSAEGADGPLATLDGARDAIRKLKAGKDLPKGGVVVEVSGVYLLPQTFRLTAEDSGTAESPIEYRARKGDQVRLCGGPPLAVMLVTDEPTLARLDPSARGKVMCADLKAQGITDYGSFKGGYGFPDDPIMELFYDDQRMTLARWPNDGYMKIVKVLGTTRGHDAVVDGVFTYEGDRPARWKDEPEVWLHGFWYRDWTDARLRLKSLDPDKHVIDAGRYGAGFREGQWFYAFNVLRELDQPGEWYLDRAAGKLYFWPPPLISEGKPAAPVLSMLSTLVEMENVSHVTLRGFTLECARGTAVTITGGESNRIVGCAVRNVAGWAARLEDSRASCVVGCDLYDLGCGGIHLKGGDRKTLTPGEMLADNNHIHDFGLWNPVYRPGVLLDGVGNRVTHNLIHDGPHFAIQPRGNDHVIEFNEIHSVCYETHDAGAIYAWSDWSQRGNAIRYNYMHHVYGREALGCFGVALDDLFSGVEIRGNVFYKVPNTVSIGGGRDTQVVNNIFVDCAPALRIDARGLGWAAHSKGGMTEQLRAMPYQQPPWSTRYPTLVGTLDDDPMAPKGNVIARNIQQGGEWLDIESKAQLYITFTDNLVGKDPGFVNAAKGDFRLRSDSPAWGLGFEPIPFEKIGLYKDPDRFSWPVTHHMRPSSRDIPVAPSWFRADRK